MKREKIVGYKVWKCKLCGEVFDKDGLCHHLHDVHKIRMVVIGCNDIAYTEEGVNEETDTRANDSGNIKSP